MADGDADADADAGEKVGGGRRKGGGGWSNTCVQAAIVSLN